MRRAIAGWLLGFGLLGLVGCDAPVANFTLNAPMMARLKRDTDGLDFEANNKTQDITDLLTALFGTPDDPYVPELAELGLGEVLNMNHLKMAAGPVASDAEGNPVGLYREHCVHCHGVTGNGVGPTAPFLNPYPRDFRMGTFKFKSTPIGSRPTHDDLVRIINNGIEGTAMPSFKLLPEGHREALITYVKYLSIRGEVERALIDEAAAASDGEAVKFDQELVKEFIVTVVDKWKAAADEVTPVSARPDFQEDFDLQASIARGRELYFGSVANCYSCHGDTQLGDGQRGDYDNWTLDFFDFKKEQDPTKLAERKADFERVTGLTVRNIIPRNFRKGVFRGGRRPVDIYWRIMNGIDGTPMPKVSGLTSDQVWDIVNYVMHIQYDSLSRPRDPQHDGWQRVGL